METDLIATAEADIAAPIADVWKALVTPADIRKYMFGAEAHSEWRAGSPIFWKGEWQGKPYEDKGVILEIDPGRVLRYSHFSPLAGQPDRPENYHTVTIRLEEGGAGTRVILSQDHNGSAEAKTHAEKNWGTMLASLKRLLEGR